MVRIDSPHIVIANGKQHDYHVANAIFTANLIKLNQPKLFSFSVTAEKLSISVKDLDALSSLVSTHTGFNPLVFSSLKSWRLSPKDYKEMITKGFVPFDVTNHHDLYTHMIPALLVPKEVWKILFNIHRLNKNKSVDNSFEYGSQLGQTLNWVPVIKKHDKELYNFYQQFSPPKGFIKDVSDSFNSMIAEKRFDTTDRLVKTELLKITQYYNISPLRSA